MDRTFSLQCKQHEGENTEMTDLLFFNVFYFILFSEALRADIYDWLHTNSIYYYYYYYTISIIYGVVSEHIQYFLIFQYPHSWKVLHIQIQIYEG